MREPGHSSGARAPLFDRFFLPAEEEVAEGEDPVRVLDRAGLRESVRRELQRLLHTRCPIPAAEAHARRRTVLEYGVADFSHLYTRDPRSRAQVAAAVENAVAAYEPRLRNARATVEDGGSERGLRVRIEGLLVIGQVHEEVSFHELELAGSSHGGEAP